ncbi:MAG: hypothetical protein JHD10_10105 [Sphingomonadaceae bacterium]|nr:hypothetical protein [Sphingomonadaceae bacterium]
MKTFRRLFVTIFIFFGSFVGVGMALAWYRGDTYDLPEDWLFIFGAFAIGALARRFLQKPERP